MYTIVDFAARIWKQSNRKSSIHLTSYDFEQKGSTMAFLWEIRFKPISVNNQLFNLILWPEPLSARLHLRVKQFSHRDCEWCKSIDIWISANIPQSHAFVESASSTINDFLPNRYTICFCHFPLPIGKSNHIFERKKNQKFSL